MERPWEPLCKLDTGAVWCLLLWIKHLLLSGFPSKIHLTHLQEMVGYYSPWTFDENWSWHMFERLATEVRHLHTCSLSVCENMLFTVHVNTVIGLGTNEASAWTVVAPKQPYQSKLKHTGTQLPTKHVNNFIWTFIYWRKFALSVLKLLLIWTFTQRPTTAYSWPQNQAVEGYHNNISFWVRGEPCTQVISLA